MADHASSQWFTTIICREAESSAGELGLVSKQASCLSESRKHSLIPSSSKHTRMKAEGGIAKTARKSIRHIPHQGPENVEQT